MRRFRAWSRLGRLERPLVVMIGGTTGVGKSTLATMLAGRLGINRVIATDVIRQVLRAFFTAEAMPSVHHSAFDAGGLEGYADQARPRGHGHRGDGRAGRQRGQADGARGGARACPARSASDIRERCVLVEALLVVEDEELHRGHFSHRQGTRPAERYLAAFYEIRRLQDHLAERARAENVAVIDNASVDHRAEPA